MNPRTERGRRTRSALLQAAREAFEQRGFDDCRMNDIADAAGVSHGTVYTYFESKEEILGQVIDELLVELQDDLRTSAKDPMARIADPNSGILNNSFFARKRTDTGSRAMCSATSKPDRWLETIMYDPSGRMCSMPSRVGRSPPHQIHKLPQVRMHHVMVLDCGRKWAATIT